MKKILLKSTAAILTAGILGGCSIIDKANGVILYGDEQQVLESLRQEEKGQTGKENYPIKIVEKDDRRMMILEKETAQVLVDKELLREVQKDDKTEAVEALPEMAGGEGIFYAKDQNAEMLIDEEVISASYEGNTIIGDGRAYADMFLIVNKDDWQSVKGTEKLMAIIQYDDDPDGIGAFGVDREQLVKIAE